jgi:hypothetical protein
VSTSSTSDRGGGRRGGLAEAAQRAEDGDQLDREVACAKAPTASEVMVIPTWLAEM